MAATLRLPRILDGTTLGDVISNMIDEFPEKFPDDVTFDFSQLRSITPTGVVLINNLIRWLKWGDCKINFINTRLPRASHRYLEASGFFKGLFADRVMEEVAAPKTMLPLKQVDHNDMHAWLRLELIPWLSSQLNTNEASLYPLQACLAEVFNNINDHTNTKVGSAIVQYYPKQERIILAISDFGKGIPENVRRLEGDISDGNAILRAVTEGFTTKSIPQNQGIGLDFLIKTVVLANQGEVTIYSRSGIVTFEHFDGRVRATVEGGDGFCPGTTIEIRLRTTNIEYVDGEMEDLEW